MTDREAIEYAENELESTGYTLETNNKLRGGLFKILSTKFEFFITAKSALQEREERSKGCEFCGGGKTLYQQTRNTKLYINTFGKARTLVTECVQCPPFVKCCLKGISANSVFIINFCPECGRPLKGGNENG